MNKQKVLGILLLNVVSTTSFYAMEIPSLETSTTESTSDDELKQLLNTLQEEYSKKKIDIEAWKIALNRYKSELIAHSKTPQLRSILSTYMIDLITSRLNPIQQTLQAIDFDTIEDSESKQTLVRYVTQQKTRVTNLFNQLSNTPQPFSQEFLFQLNEKLFAEKKLEDLALFARIVSNIGEQSAEEVIDDLNRNDFVFSQ